MGDSGREVMVNGADEVKKGLDLGFNSRAEVAKEIKDDANGDESVVLIILGEDLEGKLEEILDEGAQDLAMGQPVQDLDHHVAKLVLVVLA